jgi:hypothetical protein
MIKAYPIKINIPKYFLKKISVDCNSPFFGIIKDKIGLKKYKNELYEEYLNSLTEYSSNILEPINMFKFLSPIRPGELLDYYEHNPIVLTQILVASLVPPATKNQEFFISEFERQFKQHVEGGADVYAVKYMLIKKIKDIHNNKDLSEIERIEKSTYYLDALTKADKTNSPFDDIFKRAMKVSEYKHGLTNNKTEKYDNSQLYENEQSDLEFACLKYEPALIRRIAKSRIKFTKIQNEYLTELGIAKSNPDDYNIYIDASEIILDTLNKIDSKNIQTSKKVKK